MSKELIAFLVPTGINASIGGFAGDASTYAQKFSHHFKVIVNPNVVNAGGFSGINDNMLYVEGSAINDFFEDKIRLAPPKPNKIGVIFDKAISKRVLNVHINTINAVKTVYGIDILGYEITDMPVGVDFEVNEFNTSAGSVKNPQTLLRAGKSLLQKGCHALAVVCAFSETQGDDYKMGLGVDPVGGVEAIISHFLTKELKVPVAHAPAFEDLTIEEEVVDPRAASEYITPTYLPCVLIGLFKAPRFAQGYGVKDVKALIMPHDSLGAPCVLSAQKRGIKIISIAENTTSLNVTMQTLGLDGIMELATYEECLGYLKENYEKT